MRLTIAHVLRWPRAPAFGPARGWPALRAPHRGVMIEEGAGLCPDRTGAPEGARHHADPVAQPCHRRDPRHLPGDDVGRARADARRWAHRLLVLARPAL